MMNLISEIGFFALCVCAVYVEFDNTYILTHIYELQIQTRIDRFRYKRNVSLFNEAVTKLVTAALLWRGITKNDRLIGSLVLLAISRVVTFADHLIKRLQYGQASVWYMFIALGLAAFSVATAISIGVTVHVVVAVLLASYCWYMHEYASSFTQTV